jgi:hypothetical protein
MITNRVVIGLIALAALVIAGPVSVTQTTNTTALGAALGGGGGLTITSTAIQTGDPSQFGTYTNFTSPPVTIGDGVVLSSGQVVQVTPGFNNGLQGGATTPSTDTGQPGTAEFDAYGPGHITNFSNSNDVAALLVNFTLSSASQVGFDFIFGSVEFPEFTSSFTDAFLGFLDGTGTSNQIIFDKSGNAVQVGATFASVLTTADTNTAFSNPHGLVKLQTFTMNQLTAGSHSILFEVGDVNDHILDSAVFISNLHAGAGSGGTHPPGVPEPSSFVLMTLGFAAFAGRRWCVRRR